MTLNISKNHPHRALITAADQTDRQLEDPTLEQIIFQVYLKQAQSLITFFIPNFSQNPLNSLATYVGTTDKLTRLDFDYRTLAQACVMSQALTQNQTIKDLRIKLIPSLFNGEPLKNLITSIETLVTSLHNHPTMTSLLFFTSHHLSRERLNNIIFRTIVNQLNNPNLKKITLRSINDKNLTLLSQALSQNRFSVETLILIGSAEGMPPCGDFYELSETSLNMFALAFLTNSTVQHVKFWDTDISPDALALFARTLPRDLQLQSLDFSGCFLERAVEEDLAKTIPLSIELTFDQSPCDSRLSQLPSTKLKDTPRSLTTYGTFQLSSATQPQG